MSIQRVPTLILGIGGIGCRIAANINDLLSPEAKKHIAVVGMDTNVNDLAKLATRGIRTIQTSDDRTVGQYLKMHPEYMRWFPVNQFLVSKDMLNGAGQVRAISRMAALAAEENGAFVPIKEEINRIRRNDGSSTRGQLTVMVVGSLTGGTGAGLFLQMPFYIRKVMRGESGLDNIIVRGMFLGPDLTVDAQPSKVNREAVRVNGYACLKELNALYLRQDQAKNHGNLKIDFYEPRNLHYKSEADDMRKHMTEYDEMMGLDEEPMDVSGDIDDSLTVAKGNPDIPYDYLYLIEGSNASGTIGNAPLESVEALAASMVHTLMFTPVSGNALSVEDNMVLHDVIHNGMNRYSSMGLNRLVYPMELARKYVTLSCVRDLVQEEWLIVDQGYADQVSEARSRQRTDGTVEIPQLKNSFVTLFHDHVSGSGKLGRLYPEAYTMNASKEEVSRSSVFLKCLKDLINNIVKGKDVDAAQKSCVPNENRMKAFGTAIPEAERVYDALADYQKLARHLVNTVPVSLANEIFPASWDSLRHGKEKSHCIYSLLHSVHPLTARFMCYDMILTLEKNIRTLDRRVSGTNLDAYLKQDYDDKTEDCQTPVEALQNIKQRQNFIAKIFHMDALSIEGVRDELKGRAKSQANKITEYLKDSIELYASRILLKRIEMLAENYRIFFQSIGTMIQENEEQLKKLENLTLPLGSHGVYCSKDAFQMIANNYSNNVGCSLPDGTKVSIFESLFRIMADDLDWESRESTERQKAMYAARKNAKLSRLFQSTVVDTIRTDVVKKGAGIVDLNIRQALEFQYELEADPEISLEDYLRQQVDECMGRAAPMVATSRDSIAENTETVYMALNPLCAAFEMGEPSAPATKMLFVPQPTAATDNLQPTVLLDDDFSPYELTCFKARYKFSIEDLTKYSPTSENAKAYNTRIHNLNRSALVTSHPDSYKTIVNPHLDRYWHEEAYLPAIYDSDRKRDRSNRYKAFIYAMGLDCFARFEDESRIDEDGKGRPTWFYVDGSDWYPVKVRGNLIGNDYTDLFNALSYNGRIKNAILIRAARYMRDLKGFKTSEELLETITKDPFINDLIHPVTDLSAEMDENILNTLMCMRGKMDNAEWKLFFTGLQEVLFEYCAFLFSENERLVNQAVRTITAQIKANCSICGKDVATLTSGERELVSLVDFLCKTQYRRK